ncbi:MAG TPA: type I glyceraldehyde-3-phosphate dehydrogenase [Candidatus Hydrogenedentes bacterium]|nr:type I glyceraldehyde-3-phosphate dehydrogenase [Candidatus Hydrogenedentota bacterium]HOL78056.1 type I glyceraldehyde-3-phosphate dehydrogenase [Candidatus Hydrogenedentota bacterium]HPO86910.1 type I glyceraldehyde-3-phosphate dehydrogenase [Candidatus Hydrogenedentota bacterium]
MATKIGINGFGRIGRNVFRILVKDPEFEVVAINDITDAKTLAHLLKYDTVFGRFEGEVSSTEDSIVVNGKTVKVLAKKDPSELPWKDLGVELVLESTGKFTTKADCTKHIQAGAKKVLLSVPPKDAIDAVIVVGVNDDTLKPTDLIVSNASCTTNCLAPVAKVLHQEFGIKRGLMTTIHAYTNDQRVIDAPHKDLRRARAAAAAIIPTTTGAAKAVGEVLPSLKGKLHGIAMRVPVIDGSVVDLVAELDKTVTKEQINAAIKAAAEGSLKGILQYTEDPIVSCDVIGNPHSSVFDAQSTMVLGDNFIKVVSWYDNEWGYSNRCVDLFKKMR